MRYYINNNSGKIYSKKKLGLDENEFPDKDCWSEIFFNKNNLPEVFLQELNEIDDPFPNVRKAIFNEEGNENGKT